MRGDSHPINPRLGQEERFAQLGQPNGKAIVTVTEVVAGDIGVVTKLDPHADRRHAVRRRTRR